MSSQVNYDVEKLKYWTDKDGNTVYGNPKKYNKCLEYLMSYKPEDVISKTGIKIRKIFHPLLVKLFPLTSKNKLILVPSYDSNGRKIVVPKDKGVIFVPNHGFKDDIALSLMAAKYHSYILFASIPDFFYTVDGFALWANGVIPMDRRDKESKASIEPKVDYAVSKGLRRLVVCAEGVWSKDPGKDVLDLWKGAYVFAKKNNFVLMPMSLLNKDMVIDGDVQKGKKGKCYCTLNEAIDPQNLSWEEAEILLRDSIATGKYRFLEKYSSSKRSLYGYGLEYWKEYVRELINTAHRLKGCRIVSPDGNERIGESLLYDYEVENNHIVYDEKTDSYKETGAQYVKKSYLSFRDGKPVLRPYITEEDVYREFNERAHLNESNSKALIKTLQVPKKTREYFE